MGFRTDGFAKVWKIENKGNYHEAQISTSKKNKQTDEYETDFSAFGVRFIGTAHKLAEELGLIDGDRIKIGSCDVTNKYDKEKNITFTNYCIFSFEKADGNNAQNTSQPVVQVPLNDSEDDLPFK